MTTEKRSAADAIRAFGEARRRAERRRPAPELVEAIRAFGAALRAAAARASRASAQIAESAERMRSK